MTLQHVQAPGPTIVSAVVRDLADKVGTTHAVIWCGRLLPIRFGTEAEAIAHLSKLPEGL